MRSRLFMLVLLLSLCFQAHAQQRLVSVTYDRVMTPFEQFNTAFETYPGVLDQADYAFFIKFMGSIGRNVHFVCLNYRTEDPDGKEVIASGLLALPEGRLRGVISVSPMCREKPIACTVHQWALECFPSMRGYAVLMPDTIGYGATQDEVVALLMFENVALTSVHFRQAAQEYLDSLEKPRKLPARTIVYGYSMGAAGALATACHYHAHPELKVKPHALYLGGGVYDPALTIEAAIAAGVNEYLLYPAIARSLNRWRGLNLDYSQLLQGKVLEDFERLSSCESDMTELAKEYGRDLHVYMHPDWFTPERNPEIRRLTEHLKKLKVTVDRHSLPKGLKIYLRHAAEDHYVPVVSTDSFRKELREAGYTNVTYFRDKHGDHLYQGGRAIMELILLAL